MTDYEEYDRRPGRRRRKSHAFGWILFFILLAALLFLFMGSQPTKGDGLAGHSTILIAGTDAEGYRTDTIILLSVDKTSGDVSLLSIPRDTHVDAPYDVPKINSACGYGGGGKGGMEELMTQVTKLIGFRPDGYALIDLDAFVKIVDLMGGVDFDVPMDMHYYDPTQGLNINLSAGFQHLSGEEAIQLVRFRSGYAMADITRTEVQRDFVQAAMEQWFTAKNALKFPLLLGIVASGTETDLSIRNITWLGRGAMACDLGAITTDILPGAPQYIGSGSYYVADPGAVDSLMRERYNPNY